MSEKLTLEKAKDIINENVSEPHLIVHALAVSAQGCFIFAQD